MLRGHLVPASGGSAAHCEYFLRSRHFGGKSKDSLHSRKNWYGSCLPRSAKGPVGNPGLLARRAFTGCRPLEISPTQSLIESPADHTYREHRLSGLGPFHFTSRYGLRRQASSTQFV